MLSRIWHGIDAGIIRSEMEYHRYGQLLRLEGLIYSDVLTMRSPCS